MLSRIAESLFWIGRYVERSDGTARILDVHLQLLLEDPWIEEDIACRSLLSVMGTEVEPDRAGEPADLLVGQPGLAQALLGWSRASRFAGSKDRAAVRDHCAHSAELLDLEDVVVVLEEYVVRARAEEGLQVEVLPLDAVGDLAVGADVNLPRCATFAPSPRSLL